MTCYSKPFKTFQTYRQTKITEIVTTPVQQCLNDFKLDLSTEVRNFWDKKSSTEHSPKAFFVP